MKIVNSFLFLFFVSCASAKENIYIGSTPADPVIRSFLGIPLKDSIDFIRWQLIIDDKHYTLNCNYGIGKPNTNDFINDGEKLNLTGSLSREKDHYYLKNSDKNLAIAILNINLLHLLDANNKLLVGDGGWSYTLNNITPLATDQVNIKAKQTVIRDSMDLQGRTPCGVPGIIAAGTNCYKLKWHIILYAIKNNEQGTYKVAGTPWRKQNGRTGTWKIITGKDNSIVYQLNDENGNGLLYLLKLDENVLAFTDGAGKLLVGDEDFSYTMNRIARR